MKHKITHLILASSLIGTAPVVLAANGTAYYFDVNSTTGGFGSPSGTYDQNGSFWSTSAAGTAATAAVPGGAQLTFGATGTDFAGQTFEINMNTGNAGNWAGLLINSTSADITLSGTANSYLFADQTWTVAAGSTLTQSQTWTNSGGSGLNFNNKNVTLNGGGVINFTSNVGFNSTQTITQDMSGGTVNFQTGWTGTRNQANYTLTDGTLNFATASSADVFNSSNNTHVFSINGGTIDNTSGAAMTLNMGSTGSHAIGGDFTFTGSSDLNFGTAAVDLGAAARQITVSANTLTFGGAVSGTGGGITKEGAGTLTLSGNNTYTGDTTINAGTLQISGGGSLSTSSAVVNNANLIYGTTIASDTYGLSSSTTGTGNLTGTAELIQLNGDITQGTVNLTSGTSGALYQRGIELVSDTTITAGSITLTGDLGHRNSSTDNLTLDTSATNGAINLDVSIGRSGDWYGFTSFTANAGTGTLTVSGTNAESGGWRGPSGASLTGALNITSSFDVVGNLNLTASGNSSVTGNLVLGDTTTNTWTVDPGLTMTVSGNVSGTGAAITKAGTGTLTLSGANTFTGAVNVNAGTLKIGNTTALGTYNTADTKVTVASGATVDFNGIIDAVYGYTISGTGVGGNGALVNNGAAIGTNIRQASNITLAADASIGGTGNWALLTTGYAPTELDLAGNTLTKVGTNTFYLVNSTVTAGAIQIDGGTFSQTNANGNKPNGHDLSLVAVSLANTAGATLDLNDLNLSVGSLAGGGTTGGGVTLGTGTLTVGALNTSTSYAGVISDTGGLTKIGTGTLTLSGANTYTGTTTVSGGTLQISGGGSLSTSSAVVNNANLIYGTTIASDTYGLSSSTTGTGNLTGTAQLIQLNGDITQGTVSLTSGTSGALYQRGIELVSDTTITAGNITLTGDLGHRGSSTGNLTLDTSATNGAINLDVSIGRSGDWYGFTSFTANAGTGTLTVSGTNAESGGWRGPSGASLTGALNITSNVTLSGTGVGNLDLTATGNSSVTGNLVLGDTTTNTWTVDPGLTMTVSGNVSGTGAAITKAGTGTLTLSGANTYTGTTTVSGGTLSLATGYTHSGTGAYTVQGGTLKIADGLNLGTHAMTIGLNGVISPGNSPGTATTGSQTWNDGGAYLWEINDSGGTKGGNPGWDWLDITGTLDLTNLTTGGFTIDIDSLNSLDLAGTADGFDTYTKGDGIADYTFIIASFDTLQDDYFDASLFTLDTSGFSNAPSWDWSIVLSGNDLVLEAYAVPEPSSTALLGLGGLALMLRRKRS